MDTTIRVALIAALAIGTATVARSAAPPHIEATGSLTDAAPMQVPRAAHTATPLTDGRVLVAGGFKTAGSPAGAELYVPATSRFEPLPPMIVTRHSHTATRLPDGKVLLTGGYGAGNATLASIELFDPASGRFQAAGSMTEPRSDHEAVLLRDGRVLLVGGLGPGWTFLSSAEIFDPTTWKSTPTGAMAEARESHVAVRLADGRVLVVGGHRGRRADIVLHASAEIFDPSTGRFVPTGAMRTRRHKHDAVVLPSGQVLVTGGAEERDNRGIYDTTELYDPATGRFRDGPRMQRGRYKHARSSVVLPTGMVLIGGGASRAEVYDPHRNHFTLVGGHAEVPGQFGAVATLPDGGALITGGYGGNIAARAGAWRYRP
jgi:hypothetical protein